MLKKNVCFSVASVALVLSAACAGASTSAQTNQAKLNRLEKKMAALQKELDAMNKTVRPHSRLAHKIEREKDMSLLARMVRGGVTVSTTPSLGLRNGNVLYSVPSMNEDLTVLEQKQRLEARLEAMGSSLSHRALVGISGAVEGQVIEGSDWGKNWTGNTDLSTVELDVAAYAGTWIDAFISLDYDNSSMITGERVPSNRLYLERGWLSIGNLAKSPVYFSIGQMYVPFGRYSSSMLTTPLTQSVGRISSRSALVGYSKGLFFTELYGYNNLLQGTQNMPIDEGGANIGTKLAMGSVTGQVGAGYVSSIADSQGSLVNGYDTSGGFQGFGSDNSNYTLVHKVPGINVNLQLTKGAWTVLAEYLTGLRHYAYKDMYFGNHGAKIAALHTEIDYATHFMGRPATAAITYGRTWQAAAMNLPEQSFAFVYDVQAWRRAAIGIECRHDINYKSGTNAGGGNSLPVTVTGGHREIITLRFGVYF